MKLHLPKMLRVAVIGAMMMNLLCAEEEASSPLYINVGQAKVSNSYTNNNYKYTATDGVLKVGSGDLVGYFKTEGDATSFVTSFEDANANGNIGTANVSNFLTVVDGDGKQGDLLISGTGKVYLGGKNGKNFFSGLNAGDVTIAADATGTNLYADSVLYAYTSYIWVMNDAQKVWHGDYAGRRNWYFTKLHPVYIQLRGYLQKLTHTSQEALAENSLTMTESFYRSIMPGVVTVLMGIILVFLFNYFINFYFVNPLLRISEGISNYIQRKKSYTVIVDNDDEMKLLNDNVRELVESNRKLSKKI